MVSIPPTSADDIQAWYASVGASTWSAIMWQSPQYKSEPEILLQDSSQVNLIQVRMSDARDGIHVFILPFPDRQDPPSLHLIFRDLKKWSSLEKGKMAAGLLAAVAMRANKPRLSKQKMEHASWLRAVYSKLRSTMGLNPSPHLNPETAKALEMCEKRFLSAARLDAGEAWARLRGDIAILLSFGATEEDVVREVREIQVLQTLKE